MLKKAPRKVRNLQRSRQIVNVLVKHGFGAVVQRMGLRLPLERKPEERQ